ncbi:uncharacterized protein LOC133468674 [Phyllopteryx taeniolatus]|uniref:uncharacterized protein LOC133468674 n=1 Tax=Phyllopteryx taeniolatus TaxID=161469 RepID=UPI002AD2AE5B|nr:uncharacterized protein LOC133468674 [Phyllopteryx taeniolatus]
MPTSYILRSTSLHLAMMSTLSMAGVQHDHAHYRSSSFALAQDGKRKKYHVIKCHCCTEYRPVQSSKAPPNRRRSYKNEPEAVAPIPLSAIPHDDLPVASVLPRIPQPPISSAFEPLTISNFSVEEYQRIYYETVAHKLRFKNRGSRTYSLEKGRCIKQNLWERVGHPTFTTTEDADGRVHITPSYGAGVLPPQYDVDISHEPKPLKLSTTL